MTLTQHYRIAVTLLALAGLVGFAGCVMVSLLMTAFACDNPPGGDTTICFIVGGGFLLLSALCLALPPWLAAAGLFRRRAGYRRLALICAVAMCVLFIPIGTFAGGYILYVLLKLDPSGTYFHPAANA